MTDPTPEVDQSAKKAEAAAVEARFRRLRETGDRSLRNELIEEHRWDGTTSQT